MKTLEEVKKYYCNARVVRTTYGHEFELDFDSIHYSEGLDAYFATPVGNECDFRVIVSSIGDAEIIEYHEPLVKYTNDNLKPFEGSILSNLESRLESLKIALDEVYEQIELLTKKENY